MSKAGYVRVCRGRCHNYKTRGGVIKEVPGDVALCPDCRSALLHIRLEDMNKNAIQSKGRKMNRKFEAGYGYV